MAKVEIKVTTWQRQFIEEDDMEDVLQMIESGDVGGLEEMFRDYPHSVEEITEATSFMFPTENKGFSTLEIFNDDGEKIFENGK
jgi:hypothetical protein